MMYRLPDSLRPVLAVPFGPVHTTGEARRKVAGRIILSIGDVVTQTFLDGGIVPKLMVIDGVTQRGAVVENAMQGLPPHGVRRVEVQNPAGAITQQLIAAMDTGLKSKGSTVVFVHGEEDLAAIPAMIMAPDGAAVCYGQPPRKVYSKGRWPDKNDTISDAGGVVIIIMDPEVRKRAQGILEQMDVN